MGRKHRKRACKKVYLPPNSTWGSPGQNKIYNVKERIHKSKLSVFIINIWDIFKISLGRRRLLKIIYTYLLTYSMEQSPSREADWFYI